MAKLECDYSAYEYKCTFQLDETEVFRIKLAYDHLGSGKSRYAEVTNIKFFGGHSTTLNQTHVTSWYNGYWLNQEEKRTTLYRNGMYSHRRIPHELGKDLAEELHEGVYFQFGNSFLADKLKFEFLKELVVNRTSSSSSAWS